MQETHPLPCICYSLGLSEAMYFATPQCVSACLILKARARPPLSFPWRDNTLQIIFNTHLSEGEPITSSSSRPNNQRRTQHWANDEGDRNERERALLQGFHNPSSTDISNNQDSLTMTMVRNTFPPVTRTVTHAHTQFYCVWYINIFYSISSFLKCQITKLIVRKAPSLECCI